jgi:transposase-like protein
MRHTAEWWAKRVDEIEVGGDVTEVAAKHAVKAGTLRWWRTEIRRRRKTEPRLLPVVVAEPARRAAPAATDLELVVEIGASRLTLRGAVTPEHGAALVSALARGC